MKNYIISVERKIEASVTIEANSYAEARKKLTTELNNGTIDVPDVDQYYNDWQIDETIEKEHVKNLRQLQKCEPGDLTEVEKDILNYFDKGNNE